MNFQIKLQSILNCYSEEIRENLPTLSDFPKDFVTSNVLDIEILEDIKKNSNDIFLKSVINRIIAITEFQNARSKNKKINIVRLWCLISESITIIPAYSTIASIGSQGFLSIPLLNYKEEMLDFDFIRLHIWDKSLIEYIDKFALENFSKHTHSFHAQSWVLYGEIVNNRYSIEVDNHAKSSLFKIEYNKTLSKINQHSSEAINTGINISIKNIGQEIYVAQDSYEVEKGDYHSSESGSPDGLSASLFSFTARNKVITQSKVVGPRDIKVSKINRKKHIDPTNLIDKISSKIEKNEY